jgi:hypothetical protein
MRIAIAELLERIALWLRVNAQRSKRRDEHQETKPRRTLNQLRMEAMTRTLKGKP